ncbi:MAG: alanine racemase [Bryobacterales bacterium]
MAKSTGPVMVEAESRRSCSSPTRCWARRSCAGWSEWRARPPSLWPWTAWRPHAKLSEAAVAAGVDFTVQVEADLGLHRCGLAPGAELVALAKAADALPGLRLEGFQYYAGHLWPTTNCLILRRSTRQSATAWAEVRASSKAGLPLDVVSGGTSPTLWRSHEIAGQNEIRPGTYVYNDRSLVEADAASWDDCAATLLVTVVSTPRPGFAIVDGGSKTFTSDGVPFAKDSTHGRVTEAPEARFYKMNEETRFLDMTACEQPAKIGDGCASCPTTSAWL